MRSMFVSAALMASLITPALAQTGMPAPGNAPAYPQTGTAPAYPPVGSVPAYPQTGNAPAYPQTGNAPAYPQTGTAPAYPQAGNAPAYPPPGAPVPSYVPPTTAVPPGSSYATGARPGNDVGTGMSMPMGNRASNINGEDTRSEIAPNLPSPQLGPDASPVAYLHAAQGALASGRTGEAQQALEQAQTRLLDRAVPYGQTNDPSRNPAVAQISQALQALAAGDRGQCMQLIQQAIPAAQAAR